MLSGDVSPLAVLLLLSPLSFSATSTACNNSQDSRRTFLWSLQWPDSSQKHYLFGTIHVPYSEVWPDVSERVKDVFEESDAAVFEVDLDSALTVRRLVRCKNLRNKATVASYLPGAVFVRLKQFMGALRLSMRSPFLHRGTFHSTRETMLSIANGWERKKAEWLLFLLYRLSEDFTAERESTPMLDVFLAREARLQGKPRVSLETAEEQCSPVPTLTKEQLIFAINYTLAYLEYRREHREEQRTTSNNMNNLLAHYRCGSLDEEVLNARPHSNSNFSLDSESNAKARQVESQIREDIIVRRNKRMALRLHETIRHHPNVSYFAAIGAGHFFGNENLLSHMEALGYIVTPVPFTGRKENLFNVLWVKEDSQKLTITLVDNPDSSSLALPSFLFLVLIAHSP